MSGPSNVPETPKKQINRSTKTPQAPRAAQAPLAGRTKLLPFDTPTPRSATTSDDFEVIGQPRTHVNVNPASQAFRGRGHLGTVRGGRRALRFQNRRALSEGQLLRGGRVGAQEGTQQQHLVEGRASTETESLRRRFSQITIDTGDDENGNRRRFSQVTIDSGDSNDNNDNSTRRRFSPITCDTGDNSNGNNNSNGSDDKDTDTDKEIDTAEERPPTYPAPNQNPGPTTPVRQHGGRNIKPRFRK